MLDDCPTSERQKTALRLVAVPKQPLERIMSARGIDPREHNAIAGTLDGVIMALSPEQILDDAFRPRWDKPTPFLKGRFGDGTMGVFYSALEERTCEREKGFHFKAEFAETAQAGFKHPRHYAFVQCRYRGITTELRGQELQHHELVSPTQDGYPFCRSLAREAVSNGIAGFLTRSARNRRGTCLPVFVREALSDPGVRRRVTADAGPRGVRFQRA